MFFRKVSLSDKENASMLFEDCLAGLIFREGINEPGLLQEEVERLNFAVDASLQNQDTYFFVAEKSGKLIGTIALQPPGAISSLHASAENPKFEIGCVYVHPAFQRLGVGNFLFHSVKEQARLHLSGRFVLDAGFSSSRTYWTKQLGEPSIILKDYWGVGQPHAIWIRDLE